MESNNFYEQFGKTHTHKMCIRDRLISHSITNFKFIVFPKHLHKFTFTGGSDILSLTISDQTFSNHGLLRLCLLYTSKIVYVTHKEELLNNCFGLLKNNIDNHMFYIEASDLS